MGICRTEKHRVESFSVFPLQKETITPKVRLRNAIAEIHGILYEVVFKKSPQGEMIITKRPDMSHVQWSPAQKAQRQRFKEAAVYAKAALATPEICLEYERMANEQNKRAWDIAVSDYFKGNDRLKRQTRP